MNKTLQEIKDDVAVDFGFTDWNELYQEVDGISNVVIDEVAKRYALEACKEALKNASENAKVREDFLGDEGERFVEADSFADSEIDWLEYTVSKESILSETNIPELI